MKVVHLAPEKKVSTRKQQIRRDTLEMLKRWKERDRIEAEKWWAKIKNVNKPNANK